MRKCYFEKTRYSGDIDLGTPSDLDPAYITQELNRACIIVQEKIGVTFDTGRTLVEEKFKALVGEDVGNLRIFEVRIYFKDFYSGSDHITLKIEMDITRFDKTILPIQQKPLIHPYSDSSQISGTLIPVMKAEEILATKFKCLLQREHAPDLFDVVYPEIFAPGFELNKKEIVSTFLQKTIFERSPQVVKEILLETPFDFFKQFWKNIICAKSSSFDVDTAINKFVGLINDLFKDYPPSPFDTNRFFGPKLRNPILKAARTQTILKITYDNYERKVEPYSLKFMEPRGKAAREYLFVWNIIGGKQSTPGIRMFVPEKIQSIETTEEKFKPQYVIDLCKAGEPVADPLLYDPAKTKIRSSRPRAMTRTRIATRFPSYASERKYKIRCDVCGKTFSRSEPYDTTLNSHKGTNGFDCYGTWGRQIN